MARNKIIKIKPETSIIGIKMKYAKIPLPKLNLKPKIKSSALGKLSRIIFKLFFYLPGSLPAKDGKGPSLYCAVIIKQVDEKTRSKTSINDLLRE